MAYRVQAGNEVISAIGAKVLDITDNFAGDTPKLVIIRSTKSTSDGNYQDDAVFSFGWGNTDDQEDSAQLTSADGAATSEVGRSIQDNLLTLFDPTGGKTIVGNTVANPTVVTVTGHGYSNGDTVHITKSNSTPVIDGEHVISNVTADTFTVPVNVTVLGSTGAVIKITDRISLTSFAADTVTLSVDIYGGTSYTIEFMALGGAMLTDVFVGSFNAPTSGGNFDVTGLGFDDVGAVMMFTSQNDNGASNPPRIDPNTDREAAFSFGFFEVDNGSQCAESRFYSGDNSATMETLSIAGIDDKCWAHYSFKSGAWALRGQFTFVSVIADGFRLNQSGGASVPAATYRINFVALKGGNYEVIKKTAPTSAGTQDIVNIGAFTPSGAIFPFGVPSGVGSAAMSMGWASNKDGTKANTKEGVAFVSDDDGAATSNAKRLTKGDKCLLHDAQGSTSPDNEADLHTWNIDGATVKFTAASVGYFYHAIMFGDGTVTPVDTVTTGDPQNFRRQVIH